MERIIHWFKKPYPLIDHWFIKTFMVLGVGVFIFFFLIIYHPFGIGEVVDINKNLILGYAILVSLGLFISYFIYPIIFKKWFNKELWNIQKEITFLGVTYAQVTLLNFIYHNYYVAQFTTKFSVLKFVSITFSIGILPVIFMIFFIEYYLTKKNKSLANQFKHEPLEKSRNTIFIDIISDNKKAKPLTLDIDSVFFAQSNNNYTTIFHKTEEGFKKKLIRVTLKNIDEQLSDYQQFIRCHRSYLINKNHITHVEGNARSLVVILKGLDYKIPVSRTFPRDELKK